MHQASKAQWRDGGVHLHWINNQCGPPPTCGGQPVNTVIVLCHMFSRLCWSLVIVICLYTKYQWNEMHHLEKRTMFWIIFVFFHQALISLLRSFAVISPPLDKFPRRPPFNAQDGCLTYGTFYWLSCFPCHMPPHPLLSYALLWPEHLVAKNRTCSLFTIHFSWCWQKLWLNSSFLTSHLTFQGFSFWCSSSCFEWWGDKSPLMRN